VVPLRPLGIGELLDGAITSMRTHPRVMLGLSAVVAIASSLIQFLLTWWALSDLSGEVSELEDPDATVGDVFGALSGTFAAVGVGAVVTVLAQIILTGLLTVVVSRLVLGEKITAGEAWTRLRPHIWRLLGVSVLAFLIVFGVLAGAILLGVLAIVAAGGVIGGLVLAVGIIAGVVLAVYLYVSLALAGPALVLERIGVIDSLRRSRRLVTGNWWRVFGVLLLAMIITQVLAGIIGIPFQVVGTIVGGGFEDVDAPFSMAALVITSIGAIIATTITLPFAAAISVLLYIDQRMRREGLDLELQRAAAPAGAAGPTVDPRTAPAGPADPPPMPPQTW
jgi:hypothetical protein